MVRHRTVVAMLFFLVAIMTCARPISAEAPARDHLKSALAEINELASKAECVDEGWAAIVMPMGGYPNLSGLADTGFHSAYTKDDKIFPRVSHIIRYDAARPWQVMFRYAFVLREVEKDRRVHPSVSWPTLADAPGLRVLLKDENPEIRSLAAEALSILSQPEDIPRIAVLLNDNTDGAFSLEQNSQLSAQYIPYRTISENDDPLEVFRSWRRLRVSTYAQRAIWYMTRRKLDAQSFPDWWARNKDAQSSLWYWQQRIQCEMARVRFKYQEKLKSTLPFERQMDLEREMESQQKIALSKIQDNLKKLSPEVEAKVLLLAVPVPWSDDTGWYLPLHLRVKSSRLLDLMDKKDLWKDVDWDVSPELDRSSGYYYRMIKRIGQDSTTLFKRKDVARLRKVLDRQEWGTPIELVTGIAGLLPKASTIDLNNPNTREGFIISRVLSAKSESTRCMIAAELIKIGIPVCWPFLREEFFRNATSENAVGKYYMLRAIAAPPLTPAKRDALVDLLTDQRYLPLWRMPQNPSGSRLYSEGACLAINAFAGKQIITDSEAYAASKSDEALNTVLAKAKGLLNTQ